MDFDSIADAAAYVGTSEGTIRRWIKKQGSTEVRMQAKPLVDTFEKGSLEHLRYLAEASGFASLEDWYSKKRDGNLPYAFMDWVGKKWKGNLLAVIEALFPGETVEWWRMSRVPVGSWDNPQRRRQYLKWLEQRLNFKEPSDWYRITMDDFYVNFGGSLQVYVPSIIELTKELYPKYEWHPWRFKIAPSGTWINPETHRKFLEWVAVQRSNEDFTDWYSISGEELDALGGGKLKQMYGSIAELIIKNFPEFDFQFWRFRKSRGNWSQIENQRKFLSWVEQELELKAPEDWYNVTEDDITRLGGITLLSGYYDSSLADCIRSVFPEYELEEHLFKFSGKMETRLIEIVKGLLPNIRVYARYKHPELRFLSGRKMELDVFIPSFNFAIEYDGKQHFESTSWGGDEALLEIQTRDRAKDSACAAAGINLLRIRYDEWLGDSEYIVQAIKSRLGIESFDAIKPGKS